MELLELELLELELLELELLELLPARLTVFDCVTSIFLLLAVSSLLI